MGLTRTGFNLLVMIYLMPLLIIDIVGNTATTGGMSEFFFWATAVTGGLLVYAIWSLCGKSETAAKGVAQARRKDVEDSVIEFSHLGAMEYIYCAILFIFAATNFAWLHHMNSESTGILSIATLVWSFVSIAVAILSAIQFWRIKSGAIVELTHKVIQS